MATRTKGRPVLAEQVITGNTPGSPNDQIPATSGTPATLAANLLSQYVSAGGYAYWSNYARSLPHPLDDLTQDLGVEIYQSMQHDAVVKAALTTLAISVLEDTITLSPALDDDGSPDKALATQISEFCSWVLDNLSTPIDGVLWDMLTGALASGSRVAEQTYAMHPVNGTQRLVLTAIKVKPQHTTAFVVDAFNTVLGLLAIIPGVGYATLQNSAMVDVKDVPNLLPREKFAILTFRPHDDDPRGTSILRAAYAAWWHKMQMWPEYLKYLTQFASPIPVGTTAPDAIDTTDPMSGALVTPEMAQLAALQGIRNGAAISQPFGATVTLHYSAGAGQAFVDAIDQDDRQMTVAILCQTLATGEGRHNARAAAQVHMDILSILVAQMKKFVVRMIRSDILRPLILYNFGADAAARLVPNVSLGETETADQSKVIAALAVVPGFKVYPSQLNALYQFAGLPEADPDEITADAEAQQAGQQAATELALHPPEPAPAGQTQPGKPEPPVPKGGGSKEAA